MSAAPARWTRRAVLTGSSFFGLGYLPWAPGTWGTLGALGIWYAAREWSPWAFAALAVAVTLFGIWVAQRAEAYYTDHDASHIVIDEVAGLLVTAVGVPWRLPEVVAAFVLFRALDMAKPPPIRQIDRHVEGGLGVVLDDVVAGIVGCGILHLTRWGLGGWW